MPSSLKKTAVSALWALALLLFNCGDALAHRVSVFAWSEGGSIITEGYFSGGDAARGAKIEVFDSSGKRLLLGKTDEEGKFSFPRPKTAGDLRIIMTASMGHKGEFILTASEMGGEEPAVQPRADAAAPKAESAGPAAQVDQGELEAALERVLEKKLAPLYRMVADLKKKRTTPADVAGGIGYIVGILGIFAYFKSRGSKGDGPG